MTTRMSTVLTPWCVMQCLDIMCTHACILAAKTLLPRRWRRQLFFKNMPHPSRNIHANYTYFEMVQKLRTAIAYALII